MLEQNGKVFSVKIIVKIGVLGAIAMVLMLFSIPLWFAPSFYKIDLSEVVVLMGGFAMGVIPCIFIEIIKILMNFLFNGTTTGGIGELSNLLMGLAFTVPAVALYRSKKSIKTALIGLIIGIACLAVVGSVLNYYVMLPIYAKVFGMPLKAFIDMGSALNGSIVDLKSFIIFAVMPFNLFKGVLTSVVTMILYKRISPLLHK